MTNGAESANGHNNGGIGEVVVVNTTQETHLCRAAPPAHTTCATTLSTFLIKRAKPGDAH
jgi:hypothetical protein